MDRRRTADDVTDVTNGTHDPRDLYARNERLAYAFAIRVAYRVPSTYREDLLQEARLALWEAAEGFDPSRGCRFRPTRGG